MEGGALTRTCFLAGRVSGRTARISRKSARACAAEVVARTCFLAGRAWGRTARIGRQSARACAGGAVRAARWTARRVASSAGLLNPASWRRRRSSTTGPRGLQEETERILARRLDDERQRWGQDLHDGVGQTLSGVAFMSRGLERKLAARLGPEDDAGCARDAARIADTAEEAIAQTRSMARMLDRAGLPAGGLRAALGEMASDFERVFGVSCTFEHDGRRITRDDAARKVGSPGRPDGAVATHLYRIAQEAATNAVRHGRARHIVIGLTSGGPGGGVLTVQDDGTGFAGEAATDEAEGMGLRIMKHRAGMIGGAVTIRRRPEGGTVLTCTFPGGKRRRPPGR